MYVHYYYVLFYFLRYHSKLIWIVSLINCIFPSLFFSTHSWIQYVVFLTYLLFPWSFPSPFVKPSIRLPSNLQLPAISSLSSLLSSSLPSYSSILFYSSNIHSPLKPMNIHPITSLPSPFAFSSFFSNLSHLSSFFTFLFISLSFLSRLLSSSLFSSTFLSSFSFNFFTSFLAFLVSVQSAETTALGAAFAAGLAVGKQSHIRAHYWSRLRNFLVLFLGQNLQMIAWQYDDVTWIIIYVMAISS